MDAPSFSVLVAENPDTLPSVRQLRSVRFGTLPPDTVVGSCCIDDLMDQCEACGVCRGSSSEGPMTGSMNRGADDGSASDDSATAELQSISSSDDGQSGGVSLWNSDRHGDQSNRLQFPAEPLECVVNPDARRVMMDTIAASTAGTQRRNALSYFEYCIHRRRGVPNRSYE